MVTCFAWMVHIFACSNSPTRKASPDSCSAKIAILCNLSPSLLFCTISLTSLWKGSLQICKSAPFWYFWISLRACIPLCIFLCFSIFSSLIIFNCFSFLFFILCALFWFSSLYFFMIAIFLSPASLALSSSAFSLDTFMVLAISNNGRWTLFSPYSLLSNSIFLNSKWIQNEMRQPKFNNQHFNLLTELIIYDIYNVVFSWFVFWTVVGQIPNLQSFLLFISQQSIVFI